MPCYIRQVNGLKWRIYCDALISVCLSPPATSRMGVQHVNHYAMEICYTTPFQGLKCTPSNERVETK